MARKILSTENKWACSEGMTIWPPKLKFKQTWGWLLASQSSLALTCSAAFRCCSYSKCTIFPAQIFPCISHVCANFSVVFFFVSSYVTVFRLLVCHHVWWPCGCGFVSPARAGLACNLSFDLGSWVLTDLHNSCWTSLQLVSMTWGGLGLHVGCSHVATTRAGLAHNLS